MYAKNRKEWRSWLAKHYNREKEIWLIYYRIDSGKPRVPYNDAVEEALCYGWIDSTMKKVDVESFAQRFTPRKPRSQWSAMNIERVKRLRRKGKMTKAGLAVFVEPGKQLLQKYASPGRDILSILKKDKMVWKNFQKFPDSYKRIRIGWIEGARNRPKVFQQRLRYFLKMTAQNKRFGMVQ
ncbi:MAG TPA: YdeI/OmpD-associated family protein [Bacteroidota bacterium]